MLATMVVPDGSEHIAPTTDLMAAVADGMRGKIK